jgi:DNA-binding NtrC family response regulator
MAHTILIVDDDEEFCESVSEILIHLGYRTVVKTNPVEALQILDIQPIDLVLLDIQMPQMDGRDALMQIVQQRPEIPVIIITGQAYTVPVAIETSKKGSFAFLSKPIDIVQLKESVKRAMESQAPKATSSTIEEVMKEIGIVSASKPIQRIMLDAEKVARTNVPVLITGESGVGKEVLARAIHRLSARQELAFVSVDCGTLTETLLESELFGHLKGSFTGAVTEKKGLFETADGGTIFLDEIANTSIQFQQKLLLVLNSGKVRRVGDTKEKAVDVRVISATNRNLNASMANGEFREDLFYRLNRYNIHIPPLRERIEDIPVLAKYLLRRASSDHGLMQHYFSPAALELLQKQEWRGNVRELDNVVTKLGIFAESEEIDVHTVAHALKAEYQNKSVYIRDNRPLMDQVEEFEKKLITEALTANGGNQTKASQQLGVERTNFVKKMRKHGLIKEDFQ